MRFNSSWKIIFFMVVLCPFFTRAAETATWKIEQMPGGTSTVRDGTLEILDAAGCTAWWSERLTAPIEITYEVTVVDQGGPQDRLSDLNCFWMAQDPRSAAAPFAPGKPAAENFPITIPC